MNNRYKNTTLALSICLLLTLVGCSIISTNKKIEKITPAEYSILLAHARNTVYGMPERKISTAEKRYIKQNKIGRAHV